MQGGYDEKYYKKMVVLDYYCLCYSCCSFRYDEIQGTKTTENYSATFYIEQLFWDSTIWNFHTDELPILKFESVFNN